jgi:hypothetical protein
LPHQRGEQVRNAEDEMKIVHLRIRRRLPKSYATRRKQAIPHTTSAASLGRILVDTAALACSRSGKRRTDSLNLGRVWQSVNAPVQVAYPTTQSAKMTVCHGNCQNFCASFLVDAVPLLEASGQ